MKKIIVIFSIFLLSLGFECSSLAGNAKLPVTSSTSQEKVEKREVGMPKTIEQETPADIRDLVLKDDYDIGNVINKMGKALFLGIAAFFAFIAFIAIKNKKKFTQTYDNENQNMQQEANATSNIEEQSQSSSNVSNDSDPEKIKSAVYNFFKLNK